MKKIIILIICIAAVLSGCVSYVAVTSERPAAVAEVERMDKLGVVVLLKIKGNDHIMIGKPDLPDNKQEWAAANYSELDGSAVIGVTAKNIRDMYMNESAAASEMASAAAAVIGNGPVYDYSFIEGFSLQPDRVSNQATDSDGSTRYIKGPEVIPIVSELKYNAEDKELIPLAIKAGKESGIDGLIVIRAEMISEGGRITAFNSGDSSGSPAGDWNNIFSKGDFFTRTEIYINECSVIDSKTGAYVCDLSDDITGFTVIEGRSFYKLSGIKDYNDLRAYFRTAGYGENIRKSAAAVTAPIIPYLRPHFHTHYEAE